MWGPLAKSTWEREKLIIKRPLASQLPLIHACCSLKQATGSLLVLGPRLGPIVEKLFACVLYDPTLHAGSCWLFNSPVVSRQALACLYLPLCDRLPEQPPEDPELHTISPYGGLACVLSTYASFYWFSPEPWSTARNRSSGFNTKEKTEIGQWNVPHKQAQIKTATLETPIILFILDYSFHKHNIEIPYSETCQIFFKSRIS